MSLTNSTAEEAARAARLASRKLAILPTSARNDALTAIHAALADAKDDILAANALDLAAATKAAESGNLSLSLVKRLDLGRSGKFEDMLQGILDVRGLEDPIGKVDRRTLLDDGLLLERKSSPIGVLLIIFEARPEVIANIASLAIKSGNAAILKGGKESTESFKAIATVISKALGSTAVPNDALQLVTTRDAIKPLLALDQYIDLVIPRGGNELVRSVKEGTQIPVLGHADGICAAYLRPDCPKEMAINVLVDSKTSYPAACNSVETLLVDEKALTTVLPFVASALLGKGVSLRCDGKSKAALLHNLDSHDGLLLQDASEEDFKTEFLDLILAIKTVPEMSNAQDALDFAINHINEHGSHHTDAILTLDEGAARHFQEAVDSAGVFWNTSTRMADGQRFGFGTEVGISTNKIHARGPVGLEGLCIYRWRIDGHGQTTAEYGAGKKQWKHQTLPVGDVERIATDDEELELLRKHRAQKRWNGVD
ncbi:glutamate-5-semialdehyde dehydrogenase [Venturia nashicola]|uniref:glutamate-5-semialdehyde dehydrogenase n=1 Tax=Venturia nashicola TaxID=86259 RepID=A0A4Z1P104_9PEZI|nr:glutamate-5-semialdehyde dehydrogenase [Venturia nashicola]TLD35118.1 glutamate-5-semialdehyde dehydrogenase [Venturia nashicola]